MTASHTPYIHHVPLIFSLGPTDQKLSRTPLFSTFCTPTLHFNKIFRTHNPMTFSGQGFEHWDDPNTWKE